MVKWLILLDMGHLDPPEKERRHGWGRNSHQKLPDSAARFEKNPAGVDQNRREKQTLAIGLLCKGALDRVRIAGWLAIEDRALVEEFRRASMDLHSRVNFQKRTCGLCIIDFKLCLADALSCWMRLQIRS